MWISIWFVTRIRCSWRGQAFLVRDLVSQSRKIIAHTASINISKSSWIFIQFTFSVRRLVTKKILKKSLLLQLFTILITICELSGIIFRVRRCKISKFIRNIYTMFIFMNILIFKNTRMLFTKCSLNHRHHWEVQISAHTNFFVSNLIWPFHFFLIIGQRKNIEEIIWKH